MVNPQVIEFVNIHTSRAPYEMLDTFQFRKDRPHPWLQRVGIAILRKLRAYAAGQTVTTERHVVDGDTFLNRLTKQRMSLQEIHNLRASVLLIGAEDYADLMGEVIASQPFAFTASYRGRQTVHGFEVRVIPWMRGMLLMPDRELSSPKYSR